jgi:ATP-dependent DNA helicase RecG
MAENGSPPAKFSTDDQRTHFLVELPVHPQMPGVVGAHDEAHHEAHDELTETETRVLRIVQDQPQRRPAIANQLGFQSRSGHLYKAIDHLRKLGFIELTIPEKPQSKNQKMRITGKGHAWLARSPKEETV